jgi:hypothetical protein
MAEKSNVLVQRVVFVVNERISSGDLRLEAPKYLHVFVIKAGGKIQVLIFIDRFSLLARCGGDNNQVLHEPPAIALLQPSQLFLFGSIR